MRWPGCYDFYNLQETGRIDQAKAIDRARCTVRSPSRTIPLSGRLLQAARSFAERPGSRAIHRGGATTARLTFAGHNVWKWVNKDFPVFDPETGNNGGFLNRARSILEHVPPPATYTASLRVTF